MLDPPGIEIVPFAPKKIAQILEAAQRQLSEDEYLEFVRLVNRLQHFGLTPEINVELGKLMSKINLQLEISESPEWAEALVKCDEAFLGSELKRMCLEIDIGYYGHKKELCRALYKHKHPRVVEVMAPYLGREEKREEPEVPKKPEEKKEEPPPLAGYAKPCPKCGKPLCLRFVSKLGEYWWVHEYPMTLPISQKVCDYSEKAKPAVPKKPEGIEEQIAGLSDILDEENKAASIRALEKALAGLPEQVAGIDEVTDAIRDYRDIERAGMTPEEYQEGKEGAWEAIVEAVEGLTTEEEENG